MSLALALVLIAVLVTGWVLTLIGMPGNWLMVAATALYVLLIPHDSALAVGWTVVLVLTTLATLGELAEFLAGALGVARAGGSRRAAVLALAGSILGGLLGLVVGLPIPVIGPLLAALVAAAVGALAGAMLGEAWRGRRMDQSWRVGKAAFWARLLGTLAKTIVASVMVVVATAAVIL